MVLLFSKLEREKLMKEQPDLKFSQVDGLFVYI